MLLSKKTIIIILSLFLIVAGYFYYKNKIQPNNFVSSFLQDLEFDGVSYIDSDYFIRNIQIKSWDDFYTNHSSLYDYYSKDELHSLWKEMSLLNEDAANDYYISGILTLEEFIDTYKNFDFSNFEVKKKYGSNKIFLEGYVDVKYKGSYLGQQRFNGKRKFGVIIKNGALGWKIDSFAINF